MKRAMLMVVLLTGCEALVPNGNVKPVPKPTPTPNANEIVHRIELVLKQEGESRLVVSGDGTISVKSANASATAECQCGCGLSGCNCNDTSQDLSLRKAAANTRRAVVSVGTEPVDLPRQREIRDVTKKPIVTLYAPDWCDACGPIKAAFFPNGKARTDLPFDVVLKGEADGVTSFPYLRWQRSDGQWMHFTAQTWISLQNVVNGWNANK